MLQIAGVNSDHLLGVGVSIPGVVRREDNAVVRDILQRELNCPVIVENNVKAFAEAELIYGSGKDQENLLFVKWGPGVGACFVLHKQIYESRRFQSAEIGHMTVEWEDAQRHLCLGWLETRVSAHAVADQVRQRCTRSAMPLLYRNRRGDVSSIAAHNIDEWIACGDSGMWQVIEESIDLLARAVTNVATFLAPDQTIFYGDLFELPTIRERFLAACQRYNTDCRAEGFSRSQLSDKLEYIGPLAIVVDRLFLNRRVTSDLNQ
ncbi:MAG: ROK family protein [Clostridiales bacterium]|nr:ROK family protein [Clostridiales bacterium]